MLATQLQMFVLYLALEYEVHSSGISSSQLC